MEIEINNNRKIFALQKEFNIYFPNLKIEFYKKPSKPDGAPAKELVKSSSKTLAECRATNNHGMVSIQPGMNVGELKQNMRDVFGLSVEIIKKSPTENHEQELLPDNTVLGKGH